MKAKHKVLPLFIGNQHAQSLLYRVLAANPTLSYTELVNKGCPQTLYKYLRTTVRAACACCQKPVSGVRFYLDY